MSLLEADSSAESRTSPYAINGNANFFAEQSHGSQFALPETRSGSKNGPSEYKKNRPANRAVNL